MDTDALVHAVQKLERRLDASGMPRERRARLRAISDRIALAGRSADKLIVNTGPATNPTGAVSGAGRGAAVRSGVGGAGAGGALTSSSPAGRSPPPSVDCRSGQAVGAALYMMCEVILTRIQADRLSLYIINERTGDLQLAVNAGVGANKPGKTSHPPLSTGLLTTSFTTGIAVNLPTVSLEDVADCPGPTRARNALVFPIRREATNRQDCIAAIIAVNHCRGTEPFTLDDEIALAQMAPSISYLARQYPVDYGVCAFDFAQLHRLIPLETFTTPQAQLPTGWNFPMVQAVYHREGPEKYIRREAVGGSVEDSVGVLEPVSEHLRTIHDYITTMRACWRGTVSQQLATEREVRQKQALITDAQEILHRKQDKLRHIKDALCEHLFERAMAGDKGDT